VNPSVRSSRSVTCSTTYSSYPSAAAASSGLPPTATAPVVSSETVPSAVVSSVVVSSAAVSSAVVSPPVASSEATSLPPPPLWLSFDGGGWPQPATASANNAPTSKNDGLPGPYSGLLRLRKEFLRTLMIVICNKPRGKLMYGGGSGQARSEVHVRQIESWAVRGGPA
jgi:hypothetical protein